MLARSTVPSFVDNPITGSLLEVRRNRIGFFLRVAEEYGDLVKTRMGIFPVHIVSSAEIAHEVFVEHQDAFMKGFGLSLFARPLLGNGLLTSEHDFHRRQRKMMAPAFVHKRIAQYATAIAQRSEMAQQAWADGATIDVSDAMMRLTLEIVGKTLFDAEVGAEAEEIGDAMTRAMSHVTTSMSSFLPIPPTWPTPANRRNQEAIDRLDATVYRLIRERRAQGGDKGDFLSMLLLAQDEDDGGTMTDRQVRDEAMNIFLAGHETTANALAWTFYLLAQHPAVRERLEREASSVLGGRPAELTDLPKMPYALQVFKESMRLYPPAYVVARKALREVTIGGHRIGRGSLVLLNIIGLHRRAKYYPEPNRFDPDRFSPEAEKALPRLAWMPFGAGARVCIGNHFALMEGQIALATLSQRVRLDLPSGWRRVEPDPLITLRPRGGMPMRVTRRSAAA